MRVATSPSASSPLTIVDLPSKKVRADELRVRVRSIGVNPVDWKMRQGGPLRLVHRVLGPRGPLVTGIDFAGEVIEVGAAVTSIAIGARVVGGTDFSRGQYGSYAEEVVVREDQCVALPETVSFDQAVCFPVPGATAWRGLVEVAGLPREGARVLVLGASGGVGLVAVQLGRMLNAKVVGVCSARNVPLVERLGATALDYGTGDVLARAAEHGPFDLVLNTVGSDVYPSSRCRSLLNARGILGLVVVRPVDYPAVAFAPRTRHVFGRPTAARLRALVAAVADGRIEPIIADVLPLADAEEAHRRSRSGKTVGKLILHP